MEASSELTATKRKSPSQIPTPMGSFDKYSNNAQATDSVNPLRLRLSSGDRAPQGPTRRREVFTAFTCCCEANRSGMLEKATRPSAAPDQKARRDALFAQPGDRLTEASIGARWTSE